MKLVSGVIQARIYIFLTYVCRVSANPQILSRYVFFCTFIIFQGYENYWIQWALQILFCFYNCYSLQATHFTRLLPEDFFVGRDEDVQSVLAELVKHRRICIWGGAGEPTFVYLPTLCFVSKPWLTVGILQVRGRPPLQLKQGFGCGTEGCSEVVNLS